jgi:hypothetical protein
MAVSQIGSCLRLVAAGSLIAFAAEAVAEIDLEWRTPLPYVVVGQTFEVGLYAVSDDDTDQTVAGVDALMTWEPGALLLEGKIDNGPYAWLGSAFFDDRNLDRFNADCGPDVFCDPYTWLPYNDGDAHYTAFAISPPAFATPEGLLVTTMVFTAAMPTSGTQVDFILGPTDYHQATRVLSADPAGVVVTGAMRSLTLPIVACGSHGDFDGDCTLGLGDVPSFGSCLTGPDGGPMEAGCEPGDVDGDGDSDLRDVAAFQAMFTGP